MTTTKYKYVAERYGKVRVTPFNNKYEALTCVGLLPERDHLEAVIAIKQSAGYKGNLCQQGSKEYVAFYIDYMDGNGFVSAGAPAQVRVHDLKAAAKGPIYYAVRKAFTPKELKSCKTPRLVRVRAILSWEKIPTGPTFIPTWGNMLTKWVQIRPKPIKLIYMAEKVPWEIATKIKPPELQLKLKKPVPPVFKSYSLKMARADRSKKTALTPKLKQARNDFKKLIAKNPNYFGAISTSKNPQVIKKSIAALPKSKFKNMLAAKQAVKFTPIFPISYNIGFEQLRCVGLYPEEDILGAVFEIKRPSGYGGNLCAPGTYEYVAFYIDWGPGGYRHIATRKVKVHDIPGVNGKRLYYAVQAKIPNIAAKLKSCSIENVVSVKAILSWNHDPTPYGPGYKPSWGSTMTRRVQIRSTKPITTKCKITIVNEILRQPHINSSGLAVDMDSTYPYTFDRPFGGYIVCKGDLISTAKYYRFRYSDDNGATWTTIKDKRRAVNLSTIPGSKPWKEIGPVDDDGWFSKAAYDSDKTNYESTGLVYWRSHGKDGQYRLKLEVANLSKNIIPGQTDELNLYLDNTNPEYFKFKDTPTDFPCVGVAVKNDSGVFKKCGDFFGKDNINIYGNFYDRHFRAFSLVVFGGNISSSGKGIGSGPPNSGLNPTGTISRGNEKTGNRLKVLNLCTIPQRPKKVKCAYGIRLVVSDKAIVGTVSGYQFGWYNHRKAAYVTFIWGPIHPISSRSCN
ncbi:MAG: hypothetical protein KAW12_13205 [Candidatus Aminicenantes bacterium]|nr:hypothetical protein [Candidatus Aminicenantes bacterium]